MAILTHNDCDIDIAFSSLRGYATINGTELVQRFGPPTYNNSTNDPKWKLLIDDVVVHIYGRYYEFYGEVAPEDIDFWHVGGFSVEAVHKLCEIGIPVKVCHPQVTLKCGNRYISERTLNAAIDRLLRREDWDTISVKVVLQMLETELTPGADGSLRAHKEFVKAAIDKAMARIIVEGGMGGGGA